MKLNVAIAIQKEEVLIVPVFEGAKNISATVTKLFKPSANQKALIASTFETGEFSGKKGEVSVVRFAGNTVAPRAVILMGLGKQKEVTNEQLRVMAGLAVPQVQKLKAKTVGFVLSELVSEAKEMEAVAQAVTEGVLLGSYQYVTYQKDKKKKVKEDALTQMTVVVTDAQKRYASKGKVAGVAMSQAVVLTRDLVNTPAMDMKPKDIVAAAKKALKNTDVRIRVYTKAEIQKMKMGALLGVNAGSDEPPYFVHMVYKPKKAAKKTKKIALIGKGISFDSGGLSLKPSHFMDTMKMDMAGAASVVGVMSQVSAFGPNIEVHGIFPTTENMISGSATRPGDVLTAYNGKTIEVKNTDAEGRLILADALSWTEKNIKPDYIIDIATLTGAQIAALGQEYSAYLGTDEKLKTALKSAAETTGEKMWELPLIEEYRELMKSPIADWSNLSKQPSWAGTITASLFLQAFVEKTPWVHIDIAGPAFVERQILSYAPYGGSGYVVRTLLQLLRDMK